MIYPVVPSDKMVIILVERGRCIVARYRLTGPYAYEVERASNWPALEADAVVVIEDLVGALVENDAYPCPEELAQRAEWGATAT